MSNNINESNFEQPLGNEPRIENVESEGGAGIEKKSEDGFEEKEKKALELAEKLAGPDKKNKEGGIEVEPEDIERKKEMLVSRLVEAALAAGDNDKEAMDVIERAKKYLGKYPGILDEVHDRWLEQRNKGTY